MTFEPCFEILPPAQRALWTALEPTKDMGFVLYGGTALALRVGHRTSVDFDFFSDRALDKDTIRRAISFVDGGRVLQDQSDALTVSVTPLAGLPPVKLSFFGGLDIGRVGTVETTADGILRVASLDDLMAQKVKVLPQRVEAKDYQDIAALVDKGVSLERGLASAMAIYGRSFQPAESLKAMVYFEGGDLDRLTEGVRTTLIRAAGAVRDLPHVVVLDRCLSSESDLAAGSA